LVNSSSSSSSGRSGNKQNVVYVTLIRICCSKNNDRDCLLLMIVRKSTLGYPRNVWVSKSKPRSCVVVGLRPACVSACGLSPRSVSQIIIDRGTISCVMTGVAPSSPCRSLGIRIQTIFFSAVGFLGNELLQKSPLSQHQSPSARCRIDIKMMPWHNVIFS